MNKTIWCDAGLFKGLFFYGLCPNKKAWKTTLKSLGIEDEPYPTSPGRCTLFEDKKGQTCVVVTIMDGAEKNYSMIEIAGILVHEATHVWQYLCNSVGEHEPSVEFEAYSMQKISQELMCAFEQARCPLDKCGDND